LLALHSRSLCSLSTHARVPRRDRVYAELQLRHAELAIITRQLKEEQLVVRCDSEGLVKLAIRAAQQYREQLCLISGRTKRDARPSSCAPRDPMESLHLELDSLGLFFSYMILAKTEKKRCLETLADFTKKCTFILNTVSSFVSGWKPVHIRVPRKHDDEDVFAKTRVMDWIHIEEYLPIQEFLDRWLCEVGCKQPACREFNHKAWEKYLQDTWDDILFSDDVVVYEEPHGP
jgi:hypothetical protein